MRFNPTKCPEPACDAPAEIVEEHMLPSTTGGMIMAKVIGLCGHWFMMPAWQLDLGGMFALDDFGRTVPLT